MKRLFTAEAVTEGHPDKICDLIADSILDKCLKGDPDSRVACDHAHAPQMKNEFPARVGM